MFQKTEEKGHMYLRYIDKRTWLDKVTGSFMDWWCRRVEASDGDINNVKTFQILFKEWNGGCKVYLPHSALLYAAKDLMMLEPNLDYKAIVVKVLKPDGLHFNIGPNATIIIPRRFGLQFIKHFGLMVSIALDEWVKTKLVSLMTSREHTLPGEEQKDDSPPTIH